jgi:8-oxo-dGTP diphosphatase
MNDSSITVIVLVCIEQQGKLLLARQNYGRRYWSLPGGKMEAGESLEQAAVREVREETGLEVRLKRVVGLYSKPDENGLAICLEGEVTGGVLQADHEIVACDFFPYDDLPEPRRAHLCQRIADFRAGCQAVLRTQ